MFLTPLDGINYQNVIDGEIYHKRDFQIIKYYPTYLEEQQIENIYPIYDAKMCYEKVKTL